MSAMQHHDSLSPGVKDDLLHVIDYYLCGILTPGVIITTNPNLASTIITGLGVVEGMMTLPTINADEYKIVKSLYDGPEVKCLRDDIKECRRVEKGVMVATTIVAGSTDAQMRVREMLEDTPSMIAFSTHRSALQKKGLFFVVVVPSSSSSCPLTPELLSRASLVVE